MERPCLTDIELSALLLGDLEAAEVGAIQEHAYECTDCRMAIAAGMGIHRAFTGSWPEDTSATEAAESRLRERIEEMIAFFGTVSAPWGKVWVAVSSKGLTRIEFTSSDDRMAEILSRDGLVPERSATELAPLARELDEYFSGRRNSFDVPLDLRVRNEFRRAVLEHTAAIPAGAFSTYSRIAVDVGRPRAYRAVGNAVGANPIPLVIPCHRVLATGGGLGGYGGGLEIKRYLLELEGVALPVSRAVTRAAV